MMRNCACAYIIASAATCNVIYEEVSCNFAVACHAAVLPSNVHLGNECR